MSKIKLPHASGNSVSIAAPQSNPASDRTLYVPSNADGTILTNTTPGTIIQVLQAYKTDQSTLSSTSMADVPSLSIAITPASSSNKILVIANVYASCDDAAILGLMRDSTVIGAGAGGDAENSGFAMVRFSATNLGSTFSVSYLDSPSTTSATTYKVRGRPTSGSNNLFINRRASSDGYKLTSSITVMEVSA